MMTAHCNTRKQANTLSTLLFRVIFDRLVCISASVPSSELSVCDFLPCLPVAATADFRQLPII